MTITKAILRQLFEEIDARQGQVIRISQRRHARSHTSNAAASHAGERFAIGTWTTEEHELFLEGMDLHPRGPWKLIAHHVGSRTTRQVMTHAQKYRMLIGRRARGEATSVSPSVPALASTTEIAEPRSGANANETASSVAEPQPSTEVLTEGSSMPIAEAGMASANGEMQVSLPSVPSQLGQTPLGDATDSFGAMGRDFVTTVMDDPWFDDMGTFMHDDWEPLQF
ncbi:hypothetical protein BBJ28_00020509 [Nothophytophthora sp. Chile5]|nr:hypothetical protein BBJ28_00020509 [Nothophytophthora sp. Chile5]